MTKITHYVEEHMCVFFHITHLTEKIDASFKLLNMG
jgi:hypothetical protein